MRKNKKFLSALILVVLISLIFIQQYKSTSYLNKIVTGVSNPGRILIYEWNGNDFSRAVINVGYRFVWSVRIGDIYNDGKNVIVVGVGNGFFDEPYGCLVVAYSLEDKEWKKSIIDDVGDVRCKDLTVGDADNDGKNELVLGTHGEGIIRMYKWNGNKWNKQDIERNWIEKVDKEMGTNHRVSRDQITYDAILQTAVHIVKIGDADNDGKNEIIATMSSPLEYKGKDDIGFTRLYKWNGTEWEGKNISKTSVAQQRSVIVNDIDRDGKNEIIVGTAPHLLIMYKQYENEWKNFVINNETVEKNMKGLYFGDVYNNGNNMIVLATGVWQGLIYTIEWNKGEFVKNLVGNVSNVFEKYSVIKDIGHNSLEVQVKDIDADGKNEIIVAGESDTTFSSPSKNVSISFGWEGTPYGFLLVYKKVGDKWTYKLLDSYSVLGMDVGILP